MRCHFIVLKLLLVIALAWFWTPALGKQSRGVTQATTLKTPFLQGRYRALVIGNNNYQDSTGYWEPLRTAVADAEDLAKTLSTQYGFGPILEMDQNSIDQLYNGAKPSGDVWLLRDATRSQMVDAFELLTQYTQKGDSVLIFYAGHGHLKEEKDIGFWVPVDVNGYRESTFLHNAVIQTYMRTISQKAHHTLLISDSCFSGSLVRGAVNQPSEEKFYEKVARNKSVQIFAAGGKEFVDDNFQNSGHSPFTYFLLKQLHDNQRQYLSFRELAFGVKQLVAINADQTPEQGPLKNAGHEFGDFFFVRAGEASQHRSAEVITAPSIPVQAWGDRAKKVVPPVQAAVSEPKTVYREPAVEVLQPSVPETAVVPTIATPKAPVTPEAPTSASEPVVEPVATPQKSVSSARVSATPSKSSAQPKRNLEEEIKEWVKSRDSFFNFDTSDEEWIMKSRHFEEAGENAERFKKESSELQEALEAQGWGDNPFDDTDDFLKEDRERLSEERIRHLMKHTE